MSLKLLWTRCSSYAHPKRWRRREEKLPKNSRVVWASCPYSRKRPAASGLAFGDRRRAAATKMADHSKRKIFVKWVRSGIGFPRRQKVMVASLGLGRLHQVVACPDTPQVRGLVQRIQHLVEIVDEPKPAARLSVPEYTILPPEVVEEPALEAPVPKAEEGAAGEAGGTQPELSAEEEKRKDEAAAEPGTPKKATKPTATKDKAKAGKTEEGRKTRK